MTPTYRVSHGDALFKLRLLDDNSQDACVTDPPYGLGTRQPSIDDIIAFLRGGSLDTGGDFMGKDWEIPSVAIWREVFRVLKPGGLLLAFGGTRTYDLISLSIRAAGFHKRDEIMAPCLWWLQGQGMPKSKSLLKPAWEPICMFAKPGPLRLLRVGGCRVGTGKRVPGRRAECPHKEIFRVRPKSDSKGLTSGHDPKVGRWPPNYLQMHIPPIVGAGGAVITPGCAPRGEQWECVAGCPAGALAVMAGVRTSGGLRPGTVQGAGGAIHFGEFNDYVDPGRAANQGTADRFFPAFTWEPDDLLPFQYTPKVRGPERNMGVVENTHVSVKPISMIQWLWRLAAAPGEHVIDPFAGSGSHVVAAIREGLHVFGVEREAEYVKIARGRAAHALANL